MNTNDLNIKTAEDFNSNTFGKNVVRALCAALLCVGMAACEKKGPAERAGEKLDKAATDVGNAVEDKCEQAKESAGASDTRC